MESHQSKPLAITAEMDVDFSREKMEVFHEAWSYLGDNYFNPKMNGLDWAAERAKYEPYVAGSETPDEMRRVISSDDRRYELVPLRYWRGRGRRAEIYYRTPGRDV